MLSKSIQFDIDLMNSNDIDTDIVDILYESIDNYDMLNVLEESAIAFTAVNNDYRVLIEAIEDTNSLRKEAAAASNDNNKQIGFLKKCKNTVRSIFDWWYKEDPDKKHKTLRLVLKLVIEITVLILEIKTPGAGMLANKALMTKAGNVARRISYKGDKKILRKLLNERAILLAAIKTIYVSILMWLKKIDNYAHDKINSADIDKNITAYDKAVDRLNDLISKTDDPKEKEILVQSKKNIEDSLAELIKIKNNINKK